MAPDPSTVAWAYGISAVGVVMCAMLVRRCSSSLNQLRRKTEKIMLTQLQLAADLVALTGTVTKIGIETTALIVKVAELETSLGNVTPEVEAALEGLKTAVQAVDDLVADPAPPAP